MNYSDFTRIACSAYDRGISREAVIKSLCCMSCSVEMAELICDRIETYVNEKHKTEVSELEPIEAYEMLMSL